MQKRKVPLHWTRTYGPPPEILISRMTQRVFICDQNEVENNFIKSESLFDPFLAPKRPFFEFFGLFWLILQRFRFSLLGGARARQYTQNDGKTHLCLNIKSNFGCDVILKCFRAKNDIFVHLRTYLENQGIWSKIAISGIGRNFCHIAEISIFPYPE